MNTKKSKTKIRTLEKDFAKFVYIQSKKRKINVAILCSEICIILANWITAVNKITKAKERGKK